MAVHSLLTVGTYSGLTVGPAFRVAGRTAWSLRLLAGPNPNAVALRVVVEVAPADIDSAYAQVEEISTADGETVESGAVELVRTVTLNPALHRFIRARIVEVDTAGMVAGVTAAAGFIDTTADAPLFTQPLREYNDGFSRIVATAEADVLTLLLRDGEAGSYKLRLDAVGAVEALRREIVAQAEHVYLKEVLARVDDPSAAVTLRGLGRYADGILNRLRPFIDPRYLYILPGR